MLTIIECQEKDTWDDYVIENNGHPLQLWGWGDVKQTHGWRVYRVFVINSDNERVGGAQILVRPLPWPFRSLSYIPRGPISHEIQSRDVLEALRRYVQTTLKSFTLSVEPAWNEFPVLSGWHRARNTILIPQTIALDLSKSEDELRAAMTKKTRQYIRKSEKEAFEIRQVTSREEVEKCLDIYKQTAQRANFALHDDTYYEDVFEKLDQHSIIFAAVSHENPVAFVWLVASKAVAFELYGGMNDEGQTLRANYALKWHAIRTTKKWGIEHYDMNGLLNDGVSTFKRGFSNEEVAFVGTYEAPLSIFYPVWAWGLPLAKRIVRLIKSLRK